MLPYQTFGYRRIRVLRPLRMRIQISKETLAALRSEKVWDKMDKKNQAGWFAALEKHLATVHPYDWVEEFVAQTYAEDKTAKKPVLDRPTTPFKKALIAALGVKDANADPVKDDEGNLIPDTDLTDYENVALGEDVRDYLAREVLPHAPNAYLDDAYRDGHDKQIGVVGYELNFNRYFYKYVPPRRLTDIDAELKSVEKEIADILAEVTE
jgi:type I restriction enzyme M protein